MLCGPAGGEGMTEIVDIDVRLLHETEKAVLITTDVPENGVWIARSLIEIEESGVKGIHTVSLPEWLAMEKGMI